MQNNGTGVIEFSTSCFDSVGAVVLHGPHSTYTRRMSYTDTTQPYHGLGRGRQRDDDGVVDDDAAWREHHVVIDGALRGVHLEACDVIALIADLVNDKAIIKFVTRYIMLHSSCIVKR